MPKVQCYTNFSQTILALQLHAWRLHVFLYFSGPNYFRLFYRVLIRLCWLSKRVVASHPTHPLWIRPCVVKCAKFSSCNLHRRMRVRTWARDTVFTVMNWARPDKKSVSGFSVHTFPDSWRIKKYSPRRADWYVGFA